VSDEPIYGATMTIYASDGGGDSAKWLLGAAAAVLAFGGGYFAWKNNAPSPNDTQVVSYDPYAGEPLHAAPLPPSAETLAAAEAAAAERVAARAPAQTRRATPPRRAAAHGPTVLEATIGVATDSDEIVVTGARRPVWVRTPNPRRLAALYPRRALEGGREGEASLLCIIQPGGALDCARVSATPGGFGAAALRVARRFRHAATLADGSDAAGVQVNLRIVFRMEDEGRRSA
jgi:TonB family protein